MPCDLCVIRYICRVRDHLDHNWEIRHAINFKFWKHCRYFVKDDVAELSLPSIEKIEKEE